MNKMDDREVRLMAIFKLRHLARQLDELERYASVPKTRGRLGGIRRALMTAAEGLQEKAPTLIAGDDEARLAVR